MSRQRWFVIGLAYATLFLYGLIDNSRGPIFPDVLEDFILGDGVGSIFFSSASAAALISNITATWWLKRLGDLWSVRIFSALQAVSLAIMAYSPNYSMLLTGASLFGLSLGGLGLLVNVLTAAAAPAPLRRQLLSGLHCMYGVSSLLSPIMVTLFYEAGSGWRTVFGALAAGPLLIFGASFISHLDVEAPAIPSAQPPPVPMPKSRVLWYSFAIAIYVVVEILVSTRLVLYARRDLGSSVEDANRLLSFFYLAMFAGRFFFAVVRVPFSHESLQYTAILSSFVTISLGLLVHPGFLALSGLTMSFYYPVSMSRLSDELGVHTGAAMSWVLTVQSVALLAMHALVGTLSDAVGLKVALWTGPVCLALVTVLLVSGSRGGPKPAEP